MNEKNQITLYFVNKIDMNQKESKLIVAPNMTLNDILPELSKMFNIMMQDITIASQGGQTLTPDDFHLTIDYLIDKFGRVFDVISQGEAGNANDNKMYLKTQIDKLIPEFKKKWVEVGPNHKKWKERIDLEVNKILIYYKYVIDRGNDPWFKIKPSEDPKYNARVWDGYLQVPSQEEIKFDIKILLTSEYPKVCPQCVVEGVIVEYTDKLYPNRTYEQDGNKYVQICHDHLHKLGAWYPTLGIAHFFIRQIWVWWVTQQNHIIKEWNIFHKR